jgi:hypothetical protein
MIIGSKIKAHDYRWWMIIYSLDIFCNREPSIYVINESLITPNHSH